MLPRVDLHSATGSVATTAARSLPQTEAKALDPTDGFLSEDEVLAFLERWTSEGSPDLGSLAQAALTPAPVPDATQQIEQLVARNPHIFAGQKNSNPAPTSLLMSENQNLFGTSQAGQHDAGTWRLFDEHK